MALGEIFIIIIINSIAFVPSKFMSTTMSYMHTILKVSSLRKIWIREGVDVGDNKHR